MNFCDNFENFPYTQSYYREQKHITKCVTFTIYMSTPFSAVSKKTFSTKKYLYGLTRKLKIRYTGIVRLQVEGN